MIAEAFTSKMTISNKHIASHRPRKRVRPPPIVRLFVVEILIEFDS